MRGSCKLKEQFQGFFFFFLRTLTFPNHLWLANNESPRWESLIFHLIRIPLFPLFQNLGLRSSASDCKGPNCSGDTAAFLKEIRAWLVLPEYRGMKGGWTDSILSNLQQWMGGNEADLLMEISHISPRDFALEMMGIVSKAVNQYIPHSQWLPNPLSPSLAMKS